jgi:transposase-like protein
VRDGRGDLVHGASVPEVALRHGVNANLLSVWRRQYQVGR